jgi:acyl dehydratase
MTQESTREQQQLEQLKGQRLGPYVSHNPVSATQIWQWCQAMGDANPAYRPGEQQIAPPAMMQMWTMRDFNDQYAPGSTSAPPYQVFADMRAMGYPANVAVSYDISFHHYLRVGDRARHFTSVVHISDRKSTRLGTGYFVTERVEYLTQTDCVFAHALITYFQYQPPAATPDQARAESAVSGSADPLHASADNVDSTWQPDFRDINPTRLQVGDTLPSLCIPITHKLIVGGAIATQDFIPVHHNVPAAKAAGMPDIFMNILTTSGLSARYLSDWAGAGSRLKTLKFNLLAPNFPGDVMVMGGAVTALAVDSAGALVTVDFAGSNKLGQHTAGTATLELPATHTGT